MALPLGTQFQPKTSAEIQQQRKAIMRTARRDKLPFQVISLLDDFMVMIDFMNRGVYTQLALREDPAFKKPKPDLTVTPLSALVFGQDILIRNLRNVIAGNNFANAVALERIWDTEEARKTRFHNLQMFEPMGRAIFTSQYLGKKFWSQGPKLGSGPVSTQIKLIDSAVRMGVFAGTEYFFADPTKLSRFREVYESDAAMEWIKSKGELWVDIPLSLTLDWFNMPFRIIALGTKANRLIAYSKGADQILDAAKPARGVLKGGEKLKQFNLPKFARADVKDPVREVVLSFETGLYSEEIVDSLWRIAKGKEPNAKDLLMTLMETWGLQPKSILSRVRPGWTRAAGEANSSLGQKLAMQRTKDVRQLDRLYLRRLFENEKVLGLLENASSDEMIVVQKILSDRVSLSKAASMVEDGTLPFLSEGVVDLVSEIRKVANIDWIRRSAIWHDSKAIRMERADEIIEKIITRSQKSGAPVSLPKAADIRIVKLAPGKEVIIRKQRVESFEFLGRDVLVDKKTGKTITAGSDEDRELLIRQFRDAPPIMQIYPFKRIAEGTKDAQKFKRTQSRSRIRSYLNFSQADQSEVALGSLGSSVEAEKARRFLIERVEKITGRLPAEFGELQRLNHIERIDEAIKLTKVLDSEFMGLGRREEMLKAFRGMRQNAVDLGRVKDPTDLNKAGMIYIAGLKFTVASIKSSYLLFRPAFYMLNLIDNTMKNVAKLGIDNTFVRKFPANGVDGSKLDALKEHGTEFISKDTSIFDVMPGLSQFKDRIAGPLNTAIERQTRSTTKLARYHIDAENALKIDPRLNKRELHKALDASSDKFLGEVQFFSDHLGMMQLHMELMFPFSTTFTIKNISFWMGYFAEHPRALAAYLRIREEMKKSSVAHDGRLNIGAEGHFMRPTDILSPENIIDNMENTISPFPTEWHVPNESYEVIRSESPPEVTVERVVRSLDSGAAAVLRAQNRKPTVIQFVEDVALGKFSSILTDTEDLQTKREIRSALSNTARLPFISTIDSATEISTGRNLFEVMADRGALGAASKAEVEMFQKFTEKEYMRALQIRETTLIGEVLEREAIRESRNASATSALGWFAIGMQIGKDPDDALATVQMHKDVYNSLPDQLSRNNYMQSVLLPNGEPLLKGVVRVVPNTLEQKEALDKFRDAKTDEERRRVYQEETDEGRAGIFWNAWESLKKAFQSAGDFIMDFGVSDAGAAEFNPSSPKQAKTQKVNFPSPPDNASDVPRSRFDPPIKPFMGVPNLADFASGTINRLAHKKKANVQVLDDPIYLGNDSFQPLSDEAYQQVRIEPGQPNQRPTVRALTDKESTTIVDIPGNLRFTEMWNSASRVLMQRFSEAQSIEDLERLKTEPIKIRRIDQPGKFVDEDVVTFDPSFFFERKPGQEHLGGLLARGMFNAVTEGRLRPGGGRGLDAGSDRMLNTSMRSAFLSWEREGKLPFHVVNAQRQRQAAQNELFSVAKQRMRNASRNPKTYDPLKVMVELQENIGPGRRLPNDFWQILSEGQKQYPLIRDFALAIQAQSSFSVWQLLHTQGADGKIRFDEQGMDFALAQGLIEDLQVIAFSDSKVKRELEERGFPTDIESVSRGITENFMEVRGVEINEKMRQDSLGILADQSNQTTPIPLGNRTIPAPPTPAGESKSSTQPADADEEVQNKVQELVSTIPAHLLIRPEPSSALPPIPRTFRSTTDYVRASARATASTNAVLQDFARVQAEKAGMNPQQAEQWIKSTPRINVFSTAARYLPGLPPVNAAAGVRDMMRLGNALGFIDNNALRTINRGIAQASFQGTGQVVALNILSLAGNTMAGLTTVQRLNVLNKGVKAGTISAGAASFAKYGNSVGQLLSIGGGVALAQEEKSLGVALSTAGGAVSGATTGFSVGGPPGAAIGAVLGAALGFATSEFGGARGSDRTQEFADIRAERQRAFDRRTEINRARTDSLNLQRTERALARGATSAIPQQPRFERLARFFRRPTFQSSLGLVGQVERSAGRQFRPRF